MAGPVKNAGVKRLLVVGGAGSLLLPGGGRVEWLELFLRGGNASKAFGRPEPGAEVHIRPQP